MFEFRKNCLPDSINKPPRIIVEDIFITLDYSYGWQFLKKVISRADGRNEGIYLWIHFGVRGDVIIVAQLQERVWQDYVF